ncbi:DUF2971 domain-containing protein [Bradyrhizobium sp. S69]|uniref:DUF2971 domain-containing protein n=1 Tax=Bradyrhizobium sp. S69 TaxID=1641856 RepID=UPI00131E6569|nr:DUF2971 domain-containing protein [Bradyrhizobium sp. S69]
MNTPPIPGLPPEQIELLKRLEGIFMPHARRQRDAIFANEADGSDPRFVHYTSAENALNIIKTKRLWMRNATCMADYLEVQHGFAILTKFFSDKPRLDAFTTALDQSAPGAAMEAINLFNGWWNNIRDNTYIASISEHRTSEDFHGRLSMWRAFGNASSARVGLVFRVPNFSSAAIALGLMFSPVAYLTEAETHGVIDESIKNFQTSAEFLRGIDRQMIVNYVFTMLVAGVTCLKHEGFHEEREWRAIYSPQRLPSQFVDHSTEVVGGVPQIVYKIPLDGAVSPVLAELDLAAMFDRLIIGPSPYPLAMYEAFKETLTASGVTDAGNKIFASLIPIRS